MVVNGVRLVVHFGHNEAYVTQLSIPGVAELTNSNSGAIWEKDAA